MTDTALVLVDTNVLVGDTDPSRSDHARAKAYLERSRGLVTSVQVLREYLVVATRPVAGNGMGLPLPAAVANVAVYRMAMWILPEDREIMPVFLELLTQAPCTGKRLHDAWLVRSWVLLSV